MIIYLVKSTLLLGLLYGVYKLLLENEKTHHFNRFFLLFALIFGLTAPLISFDISPEKTFAGIDVQQMERVVNAPAEAVSRSVEPLIIPEQSLSPGPEVTPNTDKESNWSVSTLHVILAMYGAVTLFLLIRFGAGLLEIRNKVRTGSHEELEQATLVLLDEPITPQSFLDYIFLEKQTFESGEIEPEILNHEFTHVQQYHSFDVLLIEFLKVIFWFNPLLYLYKHSIQLNHEFLADEAVVRSGSPIKNYQEILIRVSTGIKKLETTSSINFSVTKKRLKILCKQNSQNRSNLVKIIIVPVVLSLSLMFCTDQRLEKGLIAFEFKGAVEGELYESEPVLYVKEKKDQHDLFQFYPTVFDEYGEKFSGTRRIYNSDTGETGWEEVYKEGILTKKMYRSKKIMEIRNISYVTFQYENGSYTTKTVYDTTETIATRSEYTDQNQRSYGPDGQLIFEGNTKDRIKWTSQKLWDLSGKLLMESSLISDSSGTEKLKAVFYDEEGNITDQRYLGGQIRYY